MFRPRVLSVMMFSTVACLIAGSSCREAEAPLPEKTADQEHPQAPAKLAQINADAKTDPAPIASPSSESAPSSTQEMPTPLTIVEAPDPAVESVKQEILAKWQQVRSFTANVMTHTQESIDGGDMWMDGTGTYECKRKNGDVFIRLDQTITAGRDLGGQKSLRNFRMLTIGDRDFIYMLTELPGKKQAERHLPKAFEDLYLGGQTVFDKLRRLYILKRLPDTELDGRSVYAISGDSRESGVRALYYFDQQTGVVLRIRLEDTSKKLYRTITLTHFEINPGLADERFVFTPPEGVEIVDMTTSTSP